MLKLNGGLGTSMGLEKAKSLLPVKDGKTFLDLIAEQIVHLRATTGSHVRFILMNSFSTSADTRAFLERAHPDLLAVGDVELMQAWGLGGVRGCAGGGLRPFWSPQAFAGPSPPPRPRTPPPPPLANL